MSRPGLDRRRGDEENAILLARFSLFLSYALTDAGRLEEAQQVLGDALAQVGDLDDAYLHVRLYWSQARVLSSSGRSREALEHVRRAAALLEATEDRRQLGRAHLLWAEILTLSRRADESREHLARAEELLGPRPDRRDELWLRVEQARTAAEVSAGGVNSSTASVQSVPTWKDFSALAFLAPPGAASATVIDAGRSDLR